MFLSNVKIIVLWIWVQNKSVVIVKGIYKKNLLFFLVHPLSLFLLSYLQHALRQSIVLPVESMKGIYVDLKHE